MLVTLTGGTKGSLLYYLHPHVFLPIKSRLLFWCEVQWLKYFVRANV